MDATKVLQDYVKNDFEHPIPAAGDVVHLVYPPRLNSVGVTVKTDADGTALFTIVVPAAEMEEGLRDVGGALVRSLGGDPLLPGALEDARRRLGDEAYAARIGNMVRLYFLSVAMMRTGVFPFLSPTILASGPVRPGNDYLYQARMLLRPRAELSDYGPLAVTLPTRPAVSEHDVDDRLSGMMGGDVPWDEVTERPGSSYARTREQVRGRLADEREASWADAATKVCADRLAARLTSVPPTRHVELLRDEMANSYAQGLVDNGTDWDTYVRSADYDEESFKASMTQAALKSLREGMALDAMADHVGLWVTEAEVMAAVTMMAPGHEREALRAMLQTAQLPQLCETTRRIKCGDYLREHVVEPAADETVA